MFLKQVAAKAVKETVFTVWILTVAFWSTYKEITKSVATKNRLRKRNKSNARPCQELLCVSKETRAVFVLLL